MKPYLINLIVFSWVLFFSTSSLAGSFKPTGTLPQGATATTLPNGLTFITIPWESPGVVAYYSLVEVGVRDETSPQDAGLAHLLEHLLFRGTKNMSEAAYNAAIQSMGADNGAFTEQDFTLYTVTAPSSSIKDLVRIESDRLSNPSFTQAQFQAEAKAVLGEYKQNSSTPLLKLWESLSDLAFKTHPYAHTVLGSEKHIQAMPSHYKTVQTFIQNFYTPDNTTIIVVGDVNHREVLPSIQTHYGSWTGTRKNRERITEPAQTKAQQNLTYWPAKLPPILAVGYRVPGAAQATIEKASDLYTPAALHLIQKMLFDPGADFYQDSVKNRGDVLEVRYWEARHQADDHLFLASFILRPDVEQGVFLERLQQAVMTIGRGAELEDKLQPTRSHLSNREILKRDTPAKMAEALARWIALGGNATSLDLYRQAILQVPTAYVQKIARNLLSQNRRNVVALLPQAPKSTP